MISLGSVMTLSDLYIQLAFPHIISLEEFLLQSISLSGDQGINGLEGLSICLFKKKKFLPYFFDVNKQPELDSSLHFGNQEQQQH